MCHRIEDDYQHLAHDYLNADDVVIARVDSSKNEIKGILPPDFPMIVLYKAGGDGESQAVLKADQITYNVLKKFVENNRVVVNLPKKLETAEPAKEEEVKEEIKEEVKEEIKEEIKEEVKEEVKEEEVKEEVKEEPKEEPKEEVKEEVKEVDEFLDEEEEEEEVKVEVQDEGMCTSPEDPCSDESGDKEEEEL